MGEPERLHPLVTEAASQVAALRMKLSLQSAQLAGVSDPAVREALESEIDKTRADLEHRYGMWQRLKFKLDAALSPDR